MFNRGLFSSARGDWETPQELFDELNEEFDFDLDVCATSHDTKCPVFIAPRADALSQHWGPQRAEGWTVWCNPPYGRRIGKWVEKGYIESQHGLTVVMLLPSRTDTIWWHEYVMKADDIRFIRGRLKFSGHKTGAPFPSCIVVFRGKS